MVPTILPDLNNRQWRLLSQQRRPISAHMVDLNSSAAPRWLLPYMHHDINRIIYGLGSVGKPTSERHGINFSDARGMQPWLFPGHWRSNGWGGCVMFQIHNGFNGRSLYGYRLHILILMSSLLFFAFMLDRLDWFYFTASQRVAGCISSEYHRVGLGAEMMLGYCGVSTLTTWPKYIILGFRTSSHLSCPHVRSCHVPR